ncbi:hypothetical protein RKD44_000010 [Streptomyces collinus]
MSRLRRATTRAPSSRVSAPATTAAAISPWECPTTAPGSTPWERQSSAREIMTAHSTGWTTSTRSRVGASGSPRSTAWRSQSVKALRASAHSPILAANTGWASRSSTAMPGHWEPWPGKTRTVPALRAATGPATTSPPRPSPANASRPAIRASRSVPSTTARWPRAARVVTSDRPMSAAEAGSASGADVVTKVWSLRAWARRAAGPAAWITHGTTAGPRGVPPGTPWSPDSRSEKENFWSPLMRDTLLMNVRGFMNAVTAPIGCRHFDAISPSLGSQPLKGKAGPLSSPAGITGGGTRVPRPGPRSGFRSRGTARSPAPRSGPAGAVRAGCATGSRARPSGSAGR